MAGAEGLRVSTLVIWGKMQREDLEIKHIGLSNQEQNQVFSFSAGQATGGWLISEFAC